MVSTFKFKTLYHDKATEVPGATHYIANEIAVQVYRSPLDAATTLVASLPPGTAVRVTKENVFRQSGPDTKFYEFVVPFPNVPGQVIPNVALGENIRLYAKAVFLLPLDSTNVHPSVEVKREKISPLEKASRPQWYEMPRPYYNSEEVEYYVPVSLPYECITDANDLDSQKDEARFRGIKKLLKYYSLSEDPNTWPPLNLFNGFLTSYVDAVYLDPRPGSKVKMLVKIPAQYFNWYLNVPELAIQNDCALPLEQALAAASRIINIPIDEIDKRTAQIQKILSRYNKQMKKASIYIPGLNLEKETDRIMKTMNNFKQLLIDNKHNISSGLENIARTLNIGLDIRDNIIWVRVSYGENGSFPLVSGFNEFFKTGGTQLTNVILSELDNMLTADAYGTAPQWTDWLESGSSRVLKKATGSFKLSDVVSEIDFGDIDYSSFEIPPLEPGDWPSFDSIDPSDFNVVTDKFQSWSGLPPFKSFSMIMSERKFLDNPDFKLDFAKARDLAKDLGIDSIDNAFIKEILDKLPSSLLSDNPIAKIHDVVLNRISLSELMAWARNNLEDIDVKGLLKEQLEATAGLCVEETEVEACAQDPFGFDDLKDLAKGITPPPPGEIPWPSFEVQLPTFDMLESQFSTMKFLIEKAIALGLIALISNLLKTVADAIEAAAGQDPNQMKDYGEINLGDTIQDAFDTDEEIKQAFVDCGIPEWMPVDRCLGFLDAVSSQLTSTELMNFLAGIPSLETYIVIREIMEFEFEEFETYLLSMEQIEDFGSCLGDNFSSDIQPAVEALIASTPQEIDVCDDLQEVMEDKCGDPYLAEALIETAKTRDIEKFKRIEETLRDPECMKKLIPTVITVPANVDALGCITPSKKGLMSFFESTGISDIFDDLSSTIFNVVVNELIEEGQKATRRLSEKNPAAPRSISALAANPSGDVIFDNAPKPASMVPGDGGDFYPIIKNGLQTSLYGLSETISYSPSTKLYYIGENNQISFTFPILPGASLLTDSFGISFGPQVGLSAITFSKQINPELQEAMDTVLDFMSLEADNTKSSQLTVLEQLVGNNLGLVVDLSLLYPLMIQDALGQLSQEVGFSNLFNKWDFKKTGKKWTDFIKDSSGNDLIDEFTHAPGDSGDNRMPRDIYGNTVNYFKPPLYIDLIDVVGEKPKVKKIDLSAYGFGEEQQPPKEGIIDIKTSKALAKANYDPSEPYSSSGLSSFQKATLQGITHLLIQIYSAEIMLRSIFVDSKFDNSKVTDQLMIEIVFNTLNNELSNSNPLYYSAFQEQVIEIAKDRFAKGDLKEDGKLITVASTMFAGAKAKAAAGPPPMPDSEDKYLLAGATPTGPKSLPPFDQYDVNEDGVISVKDSDAAAQAGNQELANNIGALIIAIKGKLKKTVTVSAGYTTKSVEEQEYDQQAALNDIGLQGGFYTDAAAAYEEGYIESQTDLSPEEEYEQQAALAALASLPGGEEQAALAEEMFAEQAAAKAAGKTKPKKIKKYKKITKDTKVTKEEYEAYIAPFKELYSAKYAEEEALWQKALVEAENQIAAKQAAGEAAIVVYEEAVAKLEEAIAAATLTADWPDFTYDLSLRLFIKEALQGDPEKERLGIKERIKLKLIEAQNQQADTSNAPILFENKDIFSAPIWQFGNEALDVRSLVEDPTVLTDAFYYDNSDVDFGKYQFFKNGGFVIEKYWKVEESDKYELSKRDARWKDIVSEKDFLEFLTVLGVGHPESDNLTYEDALSDYGLSDNEYISEIFSSIKVGKRLSYVFLEPSDDQPEFQEFVQNNPEIFISNTTALKKSGVFFENPPDNKPAVPVYVLPIIPLGEVDITDRIAQAGWTLDQFRPPGPLSWSTLSPELYLENGGFFIDNDPEAPAWSTISMGTNSIPGLNPSEIKESAEFKLITQYSIPTQRLMDVVSIYCMNKLSDVEIFKKTKKEAKRAFLITLKATDEFNLKKKITVSPIALPSQILPESLIEEC